MYNCIHVWICIYGCVYIYIFMFTLSTKGMYTHVNKYTCKYNVHICRYVCECMYKCVCICVHRHVCMLYVYVCMIVYNCIYIYPQKTVCKQVNNMPTVTPQWTILRL